MDQAKPHGFGTCCEELNEAIEGEDFDPLVTVGDDGVLYMAVGLLAPDVDEDADEAEEDDAEPEMLDHPIFFCPFCGTKVQDPETIRSQMAVDDGQGTVTAH